MTLPRPVLSDLPDAALFEAAFDAVVSVDADDRIVRWNPGAERVFGYAGHEAVGQVLGDLLVPPELRAGYEQIRALVMDGGRTRLLHRRLELRALGRDLSVFPIELVVTSDPASGDRLLGLIRDLSSVAEAERRRCETEDRLTRAEELTGTGSWSLDLRSDLVVGSEGIYRIHGLDPAAAADKHDFLESVHPDDRAGVDALIADIVSDPAARRDVTFDFRVVWPDGTTHELEARAVVELDEHGVPGRWLGTTHDVTEWRLRERELRSRDAVAAALGAWDSFDVGARGLLERLGVALECAVGALWARDRAHDRLECRAFWSARGVDACAFADCVQRAHVSAGAGVAGIPWATGLPLVSDGIEGICSECQSPANALGLRSGLAIPATSDGETLVVLTFYSAERLVPSASLTRTLTGIGHELGHFLARRRADLVAVQLSRRELEVLQLATQGHSGPQIAERLFLSPSTVKTHFENIYDKLGVSDRAAAVAHAVRSGLVP